jgi:hypothetical protein
METCTNQEIPMLHLSLASYTLLVLILPARAEAPKALRRIYVPTPSAAADKMLELAMLTRADVVAQPGCTDASVLAAAAKRYGCKARGCEDRADWVKTAERTAKLHGVADRVTIEEKNLRDFDYKGATVVCFYLLPENLEALEPELAKLPKGTRIVCHDYDLPHSKADRQVVFKGPQREHWFYLYTLPLRKR